MSHSLDSVAREVLGRYPFFSPTSVIASLGSAGGFSGAALWRASGLAGAWCLRAWPPGKTPPQRLQTIHGWMNAAARAGLPFVPRAAPTISGAPWVEMAGRLWDLTTWMPGRADFHAYPSRRRLQAACTALAQLHQAWSTVERGLGPCPAIQRRLDCVRQWTRLVESGWNPLEVVSAGDPVRPWVERVWPLLCRRLPQVPPQLTPWRTTPLPLQPCLCDVWHDHVLYTGDEVTGLVDYGAAKIDHVSVDLARLFGSLVEDNAEQRTAGLRAYARVFRLTAAEEALVDVLDDTGTLLGLANWLMWLCAERRPFADRAAVADRLSKLVLRLERFTLRSRLNPGSRRSENGG